MATSQVLMHRTEDKNVDHLLARFIETLLDVETELQDADDGQWDTILRNACRTRMDQRGVFNGV